MNYRTHIMSNSDYYPFGMEMVGRSGNVGEYRYGFQGQEKDGEIKGEGNSINYKYRMHDPRLGRFFAVDPLYKTYPELTPYQFSSNRVIDAVELEGLQAAKIRGKNYVIRIPLVKRSSVVNGISLTTVGNGINNNLQSRQGFYGSTVRNAISDLSSGYYGETKTVRDNNGLKISNGKHVEMMYQVVFKGVMTGDKVIIYIDNTPVGTVIITPGSLLNNTLSINYVIEQIDNNYGKHNNTKTGDFIRSNVAPDILLSDLLGVNGTAQNGNISFQLIRGQQNNKRIRGSLTYFERTKVVGRYKGKNRRKMRIKRHKRIKV